MDKPLLEEIRIDELEERLEFGICGGGGDNDGGSGGNGGGGNGNPDPGCNDGCPL